MRTSKFFLLLSLLLAFTPSARALPTEFIFTGSGFGHGVGLSQIGARGMAMAGESATTILQHYYTGVEVEPVVDTQTVRINIAHQVTHLRLRTDDPQSFVRVFVRDQALLEAPARTSLTFALHDGLITLTTTQGKRISTFPNLESITVRWSDTISLFQQSGFSRYKYGEIGISIVRSAKLGARLEVTNSLRLGDEYLYGVSEVPSLWPTEALKAQAIASRTYALFRSATYRPSCDCNMYATHSDQVFVGVAKIAEPKAGALWKAAVDATVGIAMKSNGAYFPAYFFSSSAGVTESALNAFGTGTAFAQSVSDTPSTNAKLNPRFYTWRVNVPVTTIAAAFGLPDVSSLRVSARNATGTVAKIVATSSDGRKVSLRGETFRSRAKIPSSWFSIAT